MSKKMMRRSLALGALMAFVITGSAWAGASMYIYESTDLSGTDIIQDGKINGTEGVWIGGKQSISSKLIVNIGDKETQTIKFTGDGSAATALWVNNGGEKGREVKLTASNNIELTASGTGAGALWVAGQTKDNTIVTIDAPNVFISLRMPWVPSSMTASYS